MTTITINGQPVPATRIDELPSTVIPSRQHVVPAMSDGSTYRLPVEQMLSLIEGGDLDGFTTTLATKAAPVDADEIVLADSADERKIKKLTWANLKAALTSVFLPLAGGTMTGLLTLVPADDDPDGTASLNIPAGADVPDVQVDGDLWADSNEDLRYRRGGVDATVYDSVSLPRPEAGEMAAGTETEPRAVSAADAREAVSALALGVGQTWQDMTGSRANGTVYQNTTGKPIQVAVQWPNTSGRTLEVSVDGSTGWEVVGSSSSNATLFAYAMVPPGQYYRTQGGGFNLWKEIRT